MKRLLLVFLSLLAATVTFSTSGQQIINHCYRCDQPNFQPTVANCRDLMAETNVGHGVNLAGRVVCVATQFDCHNGETMPCVAHCHLSEQECWCANTNYDGMCDQPPYDPYNNGGYHNEEDPPACPNSPLVIRVAPGGWRFSGPNKAVWFNLTGHSFDHTTWTSEAPNVAFLVVDRNHNGTIDDGSELFGNAVIRPEDASGDLTKLTGFDILRLSDFNHDGKIDASDPVWPHLKLWLDANHDGVSQGTELRSVDSWGIKWLGVDGKMTDREERRGTILRYKGKMGWKAGRGPDPTDDVVPYFDVYFSVVP